MSKRNTIFAFLLSVAAVVMLSLFSIVAAQKGPEGTATSVKPIKGVDVIVQKNPGNSASRITATTNSSGHFKFPVLPAGSYSLSLSSHKDPNTTTVANAGRGASQSDADVKKLCDYDRGREGRNEKGGMEL